MIRLHPEITNKIIELKLKAKKSQVAEIKPNKFCQSTITTDVKFRAVFFSMNI